MSRFRFLILCGCALLLSNEAMALGGLGMGHKAKSSNSSGVQAVRAYICTSLNCGKSDITLTQKCDNANAEMEYGVCQCKDGYIGNGKTCAQSTCTSGWMPNEDNSDCVSCPAGQECETCKSKSLFTPYGDGNGNCVCNNSSCPSGYYCNNEGTCKACATPAENCSIEADEKDPNTNCITTKKITCGENTYCDTTGVCTSCPENTPVTDTQGRCVCTETSCPTNYSCTAQGTCELSCVHGKLSNDKTACICDGRWTGLLCDVTPTTCPTTGYGYVDSIVEENGQCLGLTTGLNGMHSILCSKEQEIACSVNGACTCYNAGENVECDYDCISCSDGKIAICTLDGPCICYNPGENADCSISGCKSCSDGKMVACPIYYECICYNPGEENVECSDNSCISCSDGKIAKCSSFNECICYNAGESVACNLYNCAHCPSPQVATCDGDMGNCTCT